MTTADIYSIGEKNKSFASLCTKAIRNAVEWASKIALNATASTKCLGRFRVRLVMLTHNKKIKGRKLFETIGDRIPHSIFP